MFEPLALIFHSQCGSRAYSMYGTFELQQKSVSFIDHRSPLVGSTHVRLIAQSYGYVGTQVKSRISDPTIRSTDLQSADNVTVDNCQGV